MTRTLHRERPDLAAVRALAAAEGPWASVCFGLSDRDALGVPVERRARWNSLAGSLTDQGAPADVVAALGDAVAAEEPGPAVLAAFAPGEGPVHLFRLPGLEQDDVAVHSPLPWVLPLLGWLQDHPAHVVVVTDRTGADVEVVGGDGDRRGTTVTGPDDEIERNAPGGWEGLAQGRYQHRAEDSWQHNAGRVAEFVGEAVRASSARLVVAAGDVRALQFLEEQRPAWLAQQVAWRRIRGGRSADGSQESRAARVADVVREVVADDVAALLDRFAEERAPGGVGVEGVPETFAALARGEVGDLLLVPGALAGRFGWFGPAPTDVLDEDGVHVPTWDGPAVRAPLDDVAVRAALRTRAGVRLVPGGRPGSPAEGIGALCRYR